MPGHRFTRAIVAASLQALVAAAGLATAHAAPLTEAHELTFVQGGDTVRLNVYIDQRRNRAALQVVTDDGIYPGYVYGQSPSPTKIDLRIQSNELMTLWKRQGVITPKSERLFESAGQFIPVQMVVDFTNDGVAPTQISAAYLDVASSVTDLQPFVRMTSAGSICGLGSTPSFTLSNAGWGRAENASLSFAFGRNEPATQAFQLQLGSIGHVEVTTLRALAVLAPAIERFQRRPPKCPSFERLPACFSALERDGALGQLSGQVGLGEDGKVVTRLTGQLSYDWRDASGATVNARSPISTDLVLFVFDYGGGTECGAGGPGDGDYRMVKLALDRSNYQLALPYRGRLGPRENRRFELTLNADKASRHVFRVVLEMADGRRVASAPFDLLYFTPQMQQGEPRKVR